MKVDLKKTLCDFKGGQKEGEEYMDHIADVLEKGPIWLLQSAVKIFWPLFYLKGQQKRTGLITGWKSAYLKS